MNRKKVELEQKNYKYISDFSKNLFKKYEMATYIPSKNFNRTNKLSVKLLFFSRIKKITLNFIQKPKIHVS